MTAPTERLWTQHLPGEIREQMLIMFRNNLRTMVDPETGQKFSEETIRRVTMPRSRFYVEANAIDVLGLGIQRRAELLAQQVDPRRATTGFLNNLHGPAWSVPQLPATGGSGFANVVEAAPGTTWSGSTQLGDQFATFARDPAGNVYQVFVDATANNSGEATLSFVGISTGALTNVETGTELRFVNAPPGSPPACTVAATFTGGTDRETDAEWGQRIFDAIGERAAAGNAAHFREWARRSSNAVLDGFVFPCALHYGSVVVAVTQKRGGVVGPNARVPSLGTLNVVTGYITPPSSGVVPSRVHVVVTGWTPQPVDASIRLGMRRGSISGWADSSPWPAWGGAATAITTVNTPQLVFRFNASTSPPTAGVPQLMIWNDATSSFEKLNVLSVSAIGGGIYQATLSGLHSGKTITVGDYIVPYSARLVEISAAIVAYFDSLGLGELVDLATDMRGARAFRRPRPDKGSTYYAGSAITNYIEDALGGRLFHRELLSLSATTPTIPATASTGPNGLVPGKIAIYAAD